MKTWLHEQFLSLIGVLLVASVAVGTISLGPAVASGLERMPWLIYMYTGGERPAWFSEDSPDREKVSPLSLETVGLSGQQIVALDVPVSHVPRYFEVPAEGTFPEGHFVTEAGDSLVLSARRAIWTWDTGVQGLGVEVKVVELPTQGWAESLAAIWAEETPENGNYPHRASIAYQVGSADQPYEIGRVQFVHDRLWVVTQIGVGPEYLAAVDRGASEPLDIPELVRELALIVDEELPELQDLTGWESLPMKDPRPLHAASFGLAASLTILARGAGAMILDRGSREVTLGRFRRLAPRVQDVDTRRVARGIRVHALARTFLLVVGAGLGAILFYFTSAPLSKLEQDVGAPGFTLDFLVAASIAVLITVVAVITRRDDTFTSRLSPRWRRAEVVAAAASTLILAFGIFWIGASGIGFATGDAPLVRVLSLLMLVAGLAIVSFAPAPARLLKRFAMPAIKKSLADDGRAPVLFLRSFQDDDLSVRIRAASRGGVTERLAMLDDSTFEDLIAWIAARTGPVVAIGQPGTMLQPLGAVRDYFSDDGWQTAVLRRINLSAAVIYIVGRSPGAQWELEQIHSRGALGKTVFVFPPLPTKEWVARCTVLAAGLRISPSELCGDIDTGSPVAAVRIDEAGQVVRYLIDGRDDVAYATAIGQALDAASANHQAVFGTANAVNDPELQHAASSLLVTYNPWKKRPRSTDPFRRAFGFILRLTRPFVAS